MATREDIKKIMAYIGMAFPNYHPILDGEINSVDVLLDLLGDMPIETLQTAVKSCCSQPGRAFAPSAGEIRGVVADLHARAAGLPTGAEAWGATMESFQQTSFNQPELLQHPLVKETVHCMGGLEVIGMSENNMADRAHFLRIFEQLRERALREATELPAITEYVEAQRLEVSGQIKALTAKLSHRLPGGATS